MAGAYWTHRLKPEIFFNVKGAVAHATAPIFVRIGVRIKQYQCPKQKHVQQIFSKIRNFRWICDAHAF